MMQYIVTTREEYDYAVGRGYEPLLGGLLDMDHGLRVEIQREKFGEGHTPEENEKFYRWVWAHKEHQCEECMKPLPGYSAVFVSHILSRKEFPQGAHDPRNINILCFECHNRWEYHTTRKTMRIKEYNDMIAQKLKQEYRKIK